MSDDTHWMRRALELAKEAERCGEVPVGALIVQDGELISEAYNRPITENDATSHAEIVALRLAGDKLQNYRLPDTTLYVTLEPCSMCVGAMIHARVRRVVYGATDPRTGAMGGAFDLQAAGTHNHHIEVTGEVLAAESRQLLQDFFRRRR